MSKTQKELAFVRELIIEPEWTERFTTFLDTKFKFGDKQEKILYVNAGAGSHAIALSETVSENAEIYGVCEDEDLRNIAQVKADAVKSEVRFGTNFSGEKYDVVIADGSFVKPYETEDFLSEVTDAAKGQIAVFLPTKGSYGETFSFLWEALFETDLADKGENIERLIAELPTIDEVEEMLKSLGIKKLQHFTETEYFEFEDGTEFVNAPLAADFLLPEWLEFLGDDELEKVTAKLGELIDAEDGALTFRFSVKNTLFTGQV